MTACPAGHDSVATDYCDVCGRRIDVAAGQTAAQTPAGPARAGRTSPQAAAPQAAAPPGPALQAQRCPRCGATRSGRFCEGCGLDLDSPMAAAPPPGPRAESPPAAAPGGNADPAGRAGDSAGRAGDMAGHGAPDSTAGNQPEGTATGSQPKATTGNQPEATASGQPEATTGNQPEATAGLAVPGAWSVAVTADRTYYDRVAASGGPDAASVRFPGYCPERRFSLTGPEMRIGRRSASRGLTPEIDLTGPPLDPGISRLHAVLVARPGLGWAVIDPGSENGTLVNGDEIATGVPVPLHDGDRIHLGAWTVITMSRADPGQT